MPYKTNKDLPANVQGHLPSHAQDIYREVFNKSWEKYKDEPSDEREATSHSIAWGVVKKSYHKKGEEWVKNSS